MDIPTISQRHLTLRTPSKKEPALPIPTTCWEASYRFLLECNLCISFALFTSLNIDVLHLIIMFYLCFTFVGAILLIGDKIEQKDDV